MIVIMMIVNNSISIDRFLPFFLPSASSIASSVIVSGTTSPFTSGVMAA